MLIQGCKPQLECGCKTIRDWINELLSTAPANPNYVDVGVQATPVLEHASRWQSFKDWLLWIECFSIRSSEYSSIGARGVEKWRNGLDSIQSLDLHDSESPLECTRALTPSSLQQLVGPDDSGSQVSEVVSESNLQNVETANRVYDITDPEVFTNLLEDSSVYSYFDITDHIYYVVSDTLLTVDPSIVCSLNSFT